MQEPPREEVEDQCSTVIIGAKETRKKLCSLHLIASEQRVSKAVVFLFFF